MNEKGKNIILIGMPGCGKSTAGKLLSELLGFAFIDTDLLIRDRAGKTLNEILTEDGKERLLELEEALNCGLEAENSVIATGGSAVYSEKAMEHLASLGSLLYLKLSEEELKKRLSDYETRGIVGQGGADFHELFCERVPLYEKYADYIVPMQGESAKENALELYVLCTDEIFRE